MQKSDFELIQWKTWGWDTMYRKSFENISKGMNKLIIIWEKKDIWVNYIAKFIIFSEIILGFLHVEAAILL